MTDLQAILDKGGPWEQARIIGDQLLIQGDCREVMGVLPKVCAVVTDPPYGIGADKGKKGAIPFKGGKPVKMAYYPENDWDKSRPDRAVFDAILAGAQSHIIWGGNYFADWLPAKGRWLWWDKCQTMPSYGDGELAWTSIDATTPKKFTLANNKLFAQRAERFHPTQKPIALMEWCLGFLPDARTILDPFAGSGTTAVACQRLGRQSISIELDADYWAIMCRRVQEVVNNPPLFTPAPPKPTQEALEI